MILQAPTDAGCWLYCCRGEGEGTDASTWRLNVEAAGSRHALTNKSLAIRCASYMFVYEWARKSAGAVQLVQDPSGVKCGGISLVSERTFRSGRRDRRRDDEETGRRATRYYKRHLNRACNTRDGILVSVTSIEERELECSLPNRPRVHASVPLSGLKFSSKSPKNT